MTHGLSLLKISLFILLLSSYRLVKCDGQDPTPGRLHHLEEEGHQEMEKEEQEGRERVPHVFVAVLARNVAYLLSNFFGYLENLDYPKERMTVW